MIARWAGSTAVALWLATAPAAANDSTAELGVGGLTLTRSDSIVMKSENLRISADRIAVDYVFLNTSAQDIETLVAFPLPDFENSEKSSEVRIPDYAHDLDFKTSIDGRPATLTLVQTASLHGQDVTARLTGLGLPIMPEFNALKTAMTKLSEAQRAELVKDGLVEDMGDDGEGGHDWMGLWKTATAVTRRQVFPAGKPVAVSHSYVPFTGGSVAGRYGKEWRNDPSSDFPEYARKYCIDADFLKSFDRKAAAATDDSGAYSETWISYVLVSGANWKGPIGHFRLEVDKGAPQNLISFCETGVKKIGPTRFEVVHDDFTPAKDVDVLILNFPEN